jgi:hypothetical protein
MATPAPVQEVIPFGKYKGQPVEVLAADRAYCEWLANQDWFRNRYANLHTLIVNQFHEPSDTPDHNVLQARFLDAEFCKRFVRHLGFTEQSVIEQWQAGIRHCLEKSIPDERKTLTEKREREKADLERATAKLESMKASGQTPDRYDIRRVEDGAKLVKRYEKKLEELGAFAEKLSRAKLKAEIKTTAAFEVVGWDVGIKGRIDDYGVFSPYGSDAENEDASYDRCKWVLGLRGDDVRVYIECKPTLGDDYPGVLRQLKSRLHSLDATDHAVLLVERLTTATLTLDQLRQFFATANVKVVLLDEVK